MAIKRTEAQPAWLTTRECCDHLCIGPYSLHLLRHGGAAPRHRIINGEFRWFRPDVIERATTGSASGMAAYA